jgi:glutamate/tyrosine decarboxylase-like PLP-dependent enzyme
MDRPDWKSALEEAFEHAVAYLDGLPDRPIRPAADLAHLREALGGPLPDGPQEAARVVAELAAAAGPGILASGSGRFHGFVIGGTTPAALAADWLATAWDQNAGLYVLGPAAAVVEEVAGAWAADLLGLPPHASVGFVTGAQMANFTGLAAGLHAVLARAGWDVASAGLWGAPRVRVLAGEARHGTIDRALRFLGVGTAVIEPIAADDQGRMRAEALAGALGGALDDRPTIVCAQVGNVNTGATDPVGEISDLAHRHGAWVHVDGAFGMWAAASPRLRPLVAGVERADSWATDAHKWLNVPYDCGLVFCADASAHRAAMGARAGYLIHGAAGERDALDHNPEHSRRARGFAVYAALRALGRQGVADLVERTCALARRFAEQLSAAPDVEVLNDVVLNQVLVRFPAGSDRDSDDLTRAVIDRVQRDGTCWMSGTVWQGRAAMRISVSNWSTDESDVDRSVAAVLRCVREAG